ncbi:16S rRNA (guanine(527)-N(7))-methyltransferase RsmG [bacterium]|nr:16S rRNA (guanine(527)-N(7))-methyltransferase RsmG [bacterium]
MEQEFEQLILPLDQYSLSLAQQQKIGRFYELLLKENQVQNLTRLISAQDFVEGHLIDVLELMKSELLISPTVIDLGSGGGVPGLLSALLDQKNWILVEAEKRKAEFLKNTCEQLALGDQVRVFPQRIEEFLSQQDESFPIVARAVGPVDRIYSWIRDCSTWNTLILLKGPSWETEWAKFQQTKYRRELTLGRIYNYWVGAEKKTRRIIEIKRVPRGTHRS